MNSYFNELYTRLSRDSYHLAVINFFPTLIRRTIHASRSDLNGYSHILVLITESEAREEDR